MYKVSNAYSARPEDGNDLVQEIIVELWRAYPAFNATRAQFSTWMYRIALNVAISVHRGQTRRIQDLVLIDTTEIGDLLNFAAADRELAKGSDGLLALQQLLPNLDALGRALVLLYLEGYEQNEMAELTGLTPTSVSTRMQRIDCWCYWSVPNKPSRLQAFARSFAAFLPEHCRKFSNAAYPNPESIQAKPRSTT